MNFRIWIASAVAALGLGLTPLPAAAQHVHEGDIEIEIEDGQLHSHGAAETQAMTGYGIFEADFGDLGGGPFSTDDPGFDSASGTFAALDIVNYMAIGNLWQCSGSSWMAAAGAESITLEGNLGEETSWTGSGVTGNLSGLVGQAGVDGKIHEHLDWSISSTLGLPADGAYYVTLQLVSDAYTSSDPFIMVFNNGLAEADFENSVMALAVPEPETYAMMLAGLGLIGTVARRRRA